MPKGKTSRPANRSQRVLNQQSPGAGSSRRKKALDERKLGAKEEKRIIEKKKFAKALEKENKRVASQADARARRGTKPTYPRRTK